MADEHEGFLSRWSRRKQDGRDWTSEKQTAAVDRDETSEARDVDTKGESEADVARQEMIDNLPDPDSLTEQDDFTQFMQEGVPDDLRNRALRRLWRSNPVYAVRDGLNDYDLDYTDAATVVENIKSAFQVGRGVVTEEERAAESKAALTEDVVGGKDAEDETASGSEESNTANPSADSGLSAGSIETAEASQTEGSEEQTERPPRRLSKAHDEVVVDAGIKQPVQRRAKGSAAQRRWGGFNA